MYATTWELKKKALAKNSQNIKQVIRKQVKFILEIKLQKYLYLQFITIF